MSLPVTKNLVVPSAASHFNNPPLCSPLVCNLADPPVIPTHQLPLLSRRDFSAPFIPNRTSDAFNESGCYAVVVLL